MKERMHYCSLLLIHVWYGVHLFSWQCEWRVEFLWWLQCRGLSNNSPLDRSVSWKVNLNHGSFLQTLPFRISREIGLKSPVWAGLLLDKMRKITLELSSTWIERNDGSFSKAGKADFFKVCQSFWQIWHVELCTVGKWKLWHPLWFFWRLSAGYILNHSTQQITHD